MINFSLFAPLLAITQNLGLSHDQTTGKNTPKNVAKYISGKYYQDSLVIPNLIAGHTYYLMVTFYADGSTYSQVTNSVRIR